MKWCPLNTYRHTLTFDAVHDAEGRAQVCKPRGAELLSLFPELAFCNENKFIKSYFMLKTMVLPIENLILHTYKNVHYFKRQLFLYENYR